MRRSDVREGMRVFGSDGATLGRVRRLCDHTFVVEKRGLTRKRYVALYARIREVTGGAIHLSETGAQMEAEAYATPPLEREARMQAH